MKGFVEKALFITGLVLLGAGGATGQTRPLPPPASNPVDFGRDIAPVLKKRCVPCHGAALQQSGLRLDSREALLKGGSSGPVIAPGDSAGSRLIRLVGGADPEVVMPPAGPRLSEVEVGLFRAWIDTGAVWPQEVVFDGGQGARPKSSHWSFQPILHPQPPSVQRASWLKNPIDAFVLAKLESEGIEPSPEAEREKLIRRLSLDLTGLPPTPDEVASFMADSRPASNSGRDHRLHPIRHPQSQFRN